MATSLADNIFLCIFLCENDQIPIQISLKLVPRSPIENKPALVQVMVWRRTGDKPLPEPIMTKFTDAYMRHWGRWVNRHTIHFPYKLVIQSDTDHIFNSQHTPHTSSSRASYMVSFVHILGTVVRAIMTLLSEWNQQLAIILCHRTIVNNARQMLFPVYVCTAVNKGTPIWNMHCMVISPRIKHVLKC